MDDTEDEKEEEDDPLRWETVDAGTAYACPGFEIRNERVRLPDGTETDFDYLTEDDSVVVLPFTPDGRVVLVEEWRQAVKRVNRGLPAGGVEDGEDPRAAARRELAEETGYEAAETAHLAALEPANGVSDMLFHYVLATGCEPTAQQDLDFNESIRVETTGYDELLAAVRGGRVRDGRTAMAVFQYEFGTPGSETA